MTAGPEDPREAVLYSREACAPCFALRRLAQRSARRHRMRLVVLDVDADAARRSRYGDQVPVLQLPGGASIAGRAGAGTVDAAFRQAAALLRNARVSHDGPGGSCVPGRRRGLAWIRRTLGLDSETKRT